jgi:hypothetical protein
VPIEKVDSACFTESAYIDPSDSLLGACHVLRMVGKKAMRSINVASKTDHKNVTFRSITKYEIDKGEYTDRGGASHARGSSPCSVMVDVD